MAKTFPTSFVGWYVAVNDQRPRNPRSHHRRDSCVLRLFGCAGRPHGNAAVWGGGVGAVVAGAAAHPSGSVAAAFDGALGGGSVAWLRRRRVLRQQIALHAMLVGAATRLRLRRDPKHALGLEAARFHDQRAPERRRSVYGLRGVAEDVVLSAYDIGLLRIHQQGRLLKVGGYLGK